MLSALLKGTVMIVLILRDWLILCQRINPQRLPLLMIMNLLVSTMKATGYKKYGYNSNSKVNALFSLGWILDYVRFTFFILI